MMNCKHKWVLADIHRVSGASDTFKFFCENCLKIELRKANTEGKNEKN